MDKQQDYELFRPDEYTRAALRRGDKKAKRHRAALRAARARYEALIAPTLPASMKRARDVNWHSPEARAKRIATTRRIVARLEARAAL